ncbi:MAG: hypothetical protein HY530_04880 [Chloroflexi bacterium]|nr:hypothetical protein [Chloroflexota bacterium]
MRKEVSSIVCVDESHGFEFNVPPMAGATSDMGLARFHDRNRETLEKKGITVARRFN